MLFPIKGTVGPRALSSGLETEGNTDLEQVVLMRDEESIPFQAIRALSCLVLFHPTPHALF